MSDQMTLFEQNSWDVTIAYDDSAMIVTLNLKMDRHMEIVFQRMIRGLEGVDDCQPDRTVNRYSENTSFRVTMRQSHIGDLLPEIQAGVRTLAEQHVAFVQAIPAQQSLF